MNGEWREGERLSGGRRGNAQRATFNFQRSTKDTKQSAKRGAASKA
jgi:hypothetical protein